MDNVTVVIPTSPIFSHPSTEIIDETINSIRRHLPTSEIIIMVDGIRTEQLHFKENYYEYKRRLLWKSNQEWYNVRCKIYNEYSHQAKMMIETLKEIKTPILLFTEHDMPIVDREIQFKECVEAIITNQANVVRFCMEPLIIEAWQHLMLDKTPQMICGAPILRTIQWSQRTHLASVPFYRQIMTKYFNERSRTFIEDPIHGKPGEAYYKNGIAGWNQWKLWIYAPPEDMQCCYHIDGRGQEPKYEMIF